MSVSADIKAVCVCLRLLERQFRIQGLDSRVQGSRLRQALARRDSTSRVSDFRGWGVEH